MISISVIFLISSVEIKSPIFYFAFILKLDYFLIKYILISVLPLFIHQVPPKFHYFWSFLSLSLKKNGILRDNKLDKIKYNKMKKANNIEVVHGNSRGRKKSQEQAKTSETHLFS